MKINIQKVLPFITEQSTTNSIARLINSILVLEEKLSHPSRQSEYFRWGLQGHSEHLSALQKQYKVIRVDFNDNTVDELISRLKTEEQFFQKIIKPTFPIFIKIITKNASDTRIAKLNDYIHMKSIIVQLPTFEELRVDSDLLLKLLR